MHQFTEPTPTSMRRAVQLEVFVEAWEIECCAPPPVVGERSGGWGLTFFSSLCTWPELDRTRSWWVERNVGTWLADGSVRARWSDHNGPPPEPGRQAVRGWLLGTVHESPEAVEKMTGTVQRVRLVTMDYRLDEDARTLRPLPGTTALIDVAASPRWFTERPLQVPGDRRTRKAGVLLDLTVPVGADRNPSK